MGETGEGVGSEEVGVAELLEGGLLFFFLWGGWGFLCGKASQLTVFLSRRSIL